MTKIKLNCILLIGNDEVTNYIHKRVIDEIGCAEKVVAVKSGQAALDFLSGQKNGIRPQPELIFLDNDLPKMNGWEFLENYGKLRTPKQAKTVLVLLKTNLGHDDLTSASNIAEIDGFGSKPLNREKMNRTLLHHFSSSS